MCALSLSLEAQHASSDYIHSKNPQAMLIRVHYPSTYTLHVSPDREVEPHTKADRRTVKNVKMMGMSTGQNDSRSALDW